MKSAQWMRFAWRVLLVLILLAGLTAAGLPKLLNGLGLNRAYAGRNFQLSGRKALIITTSHDRLGEGGPATGVYASEMTVPYYQFLDSGMLVDIASVDGGKVPVEPVSLRWPLATGQDQRYLKDAQFLSKTEKSLRLDQVDYGQYDLIFLAGGWGAAYDLGFSDALGQQITAAYAAQIPMGAVCHGALGFLRALGPDGAPLVRGKHMTAVTDKQVRELRIEITPQHPERELRQAGALYESSTAFRDVFASHVVKDGILVTGQNQNDAAQVAQGLMALVEARQK